jgi:hypothetical protein
MKYVGGAIVSRNPSGRRPSCSSCSGSTSVYFDQRWRLRPLKTRLASRAAKLGGERVRHAQRGRDFAQAPELPVLEVSRLRRHRLVALRDVARLAPERALLVRLFVTRGLVRAVRTRPCVLKTLNPPL